MLLLTHSVLRLILLLDRQGTDKGKCSAVGGSDGCFQCRCPTSKAETHGKTPCQANQSNLIVDRDGNPPGPYCSGCALEGIEIVWKQRDDTREEI